jgi:signal transduction histidine kinase
MPSVDQDVLDEAHDAVRELPGPVPVRPAPRWTWRDLRAPVIVSAAATAAAGAWALLALVDLVPMSPAVFVAWLVALELANVPLFVRVWRLRARLDIETQLTAVFWAGLAVWFWLPAPVYYLVTMNLDALQLKWTAIAFLWEVPVIGGAFVVTARWLFGPVSAFLRGEVAAAAAQPRLRRYPPTVAAAVILFAVVGYGVGALQLRVFAGLPPIEQLKNVLHGLMVSLLLGVFYYIVVDQLLAPVRRAAAEAGTPVAGRSLERRIFTVTLMITLGGFALISLCVLQTSQRTIHALVQAQLQAWVATEGRASAGGLNLEVVVPHDETTARLSPETLEAIAAARSGVVQDTRGRLKLVAWIGTPEGGRQVYVSSLVDHYGPLRTAVGYLALAGAVVLIVSVGMLTFGTHATTRALRRLAHAVRGVEAGRVDEHALELYTGDEVEELAAVVSRYVRHSWHAQQTLEAHAAEKTAALRDKLAALQRAEGELRRYAERLETLQAIDRAILATESPADVAFGALDRVRRRVSAEVGGVLTIDDRGHVRQLAATPAFDIGGGVPLAATPEAALAIVRERLAERGMRSIVCEPLVAGGRIEGMLALASVHLRAIDAGHEDLVRAAASELGAVLREGRLRQAIAAERRRLESLIAHLPEAVMLLDDERRIIVANPAAHAILPRLASGDVEEPLRRLGGRALEELEARADGSQWHEIVAPGTPPAVFEVAVRPLARPTEPGAAVVIRDVTREREVQRRSEEHARLAAVGQLAAGVAHDFNNILSAIIAAADLLRMRPNEQHEVVNRLQMITDQGMRAAALTRQILDFSRKSSPALRTIDLASLLGELVVLLQRTLPETIEIERELPPDSYTVDADPNQLSQVIMNIALNARDAMPDGGRLTFRLGRRRVEAGEMPAGVAVEPGDWLELVIADTGAGMPPEVRARIFEPFFTTKEPGRGTGLGLSQAYGIVQQHRGQIAVDSEPGRGTTFTVLLPARDAAVPAAPPTRPAPPEGRGETLLLVEDDPAVRQSLGDALGALNYRVLRAASGEEALAVLRREPAPVDLLLTDLVMPGIGGIGLIQALAHEARRPARAVVMTGYVEEQGRRAAEASELVVGWIQKPVNLTEVARAIRAALSS